MPVPAIRPSEVVGSQAVSAETGSREAFSQIQDAAGRQTTPSEPASGLKIRLPLLHGVAPRADGFIHLEDYRSRAAELEEAFSEKVKELAVEVEATIPPAIDVSLDFSRQGSGKIVVDRSHPKAEVLEKQLNEDDSLNRAFREVNALREMIRAADEASAFQKAYRQNPKMAVNRFSWLFDSTRCKPVYHFQLCLDKGVGHFAVSGRQS